MNLSVRFFFSSSKLGHTLILLILSAFSWCHQTAYFSWGNQIRKIDNFWGMIFFFSRQHYTHHDEFFFQNAIRFFKEQQDDFFFDIWKRLIFFFVEAV